MALFNIKPTRAQAEEKVDLICDLDVIAETKSTVKIFGKTHYLKPVTTEVFFQFAGAYADIAKMSNSSPEEINEQYGKLVNSVCPTITKKNVEQMTMVQKWALVNGLANKILGQPQDGEKKKTLANPTQTS